NNLQDGTEV
nr:Chain X, (asn)(asn)(leu)(gln)(asp)(gly)(thr)(glu)(val) [synthetic construct]2QT5_Y Chain Y, (asn)(asn)(leu)(gln)(asp)(gly)(thr)(glu)(val) [synthetic construct]